MNTAEPNEFKLHFLDYWRVIRVRFGIIILAFLLVVITVGVRTYFAPRLYESKVTMEVQPDHADVRIFQPTVEGATFGDPRFASTQFQIIQRNEILYPVIDELKLQEKWSQPGMPLGKQQTVVKLQNMMSIKDVRNTNLIEVSVLSEDPQEAAQIANTIAIVYQNRRIEEHEKVISAAMAQLQDEVAKLQRKVEESFAEMVRLAKESGISDLAVGLDDTVITPENSLLLNEEAEVNQLRSKVAALRTKLDQVDKLKGEELMRALTTLDIPDPTVQLVLPQFQQAEVEEARLLNSGLGRNHPQVKALRAQKAVFVQQLNDSVEMIKQSLQINLRIDESTLAALEEKLEARRAAQQDVRSASSTYTEAKNRYVTNKRILEAAQSRYQTQIMELNMPRNPAKIWEKAEPAAFPSRPRVMVNMIIGVLIGLIVGVGLAVFIEYLDTSVKTLEDVETYLGVPVLAVFPKGISVLHRQPSDTPDAEAYRILRTNVEFNRKSADANAITVVSGGPGEGKSTTLANLAYTCSQGGYNVLVVDADLRRPVQHELFGLENSIGLTNYLTTDLKLEDVIRKSGIENLSVMTSGILPSDAVGVLNSQRMSDMIADLKARYDVVFFDSPPILGVSDASVLASEVDLTIIVVQHRRFPRSMLQRVKQAVVNVGGTVLGVVLNNVDTKHDQRYEYYTSYYNYYYSSPKDRKRRSSNSGLSLPEDLAAGRDEY
jgi:succinoglycan biosynthesis transport protein ExoP